MTLDVDAVALQRRGGERRPAGLALRGLVLEPPAQVLIEALVRDRKDELLRVRVLLLDPGLRLALCAEGSVATDPLAVAVEAKIDPSHEATPPRCDAPGPLAGPLAPARRHAHPPARR
jgi:hypothetical protein